MAAVAALLPPSPSPSPLPAGRRRAGAGRGEATPPATIRPLEGQAGRPPLPPCHPFHCARRQGRPEGVAQGEQRSAPVGMAAPAAALALPRAASSAASPASAVAKKNMQMSSGGGCRQAKSGGGVCGGGASGEGGRERSVGRRSRRPAGAAAAWAACYSRRLRAHSLLQACAPHAPAPGTAPRLWGWPARRAPRAAAAWRAWCGSWGGWPRPAGSAGRGGAGVRRWVAPQGSRLSTARTHAHMPHHHCFLHTHTHTTPHHHCFTPTLTHHNPHRMPPTPTTSCRPPTHPAYLHRGEQLRDALPKGDHPRQQLVRLVRPAPLGLLVGGRKLRRLLCLRHLPKQIRLHEWQQHQQAVIQAARRAHPRHRLHHRVHRVAQHVGGVAARGAGCRGGGAGGGGWAGGG